MSNMHEHARDAGIATFWIVAMAVAAVLALIVAGGLWLTLGEGAFISKHTQNIRHSIGYVDAQNAHCQQDISDYAAAKAAYDRDAGDAQAQRADSAHANALVADCRATVGQLQPDEVAPPVAQFLAAHQEG